MTTSRKSFLSFAVACIVALMAATAAFASNSADTDFTFKFSGGLPQRTEWRSKTDDTNVYMSVKGVQHAFTAHVVGADNNYSTTAHDCSHGYTYSISNVGVYRMRNWVPVSNAIQILLYTIPAVLKIALPGKAAPARRIFCELLTVAAAMIVVLLFYI